MNFTQLKIFSISIRSSMVLVTQLYSLTVFFGLILKIKFQFAKQNIFCEYKFKTIILFHMEIFHYTR